MVGFFLTIALLDGLRRRRRMRAAVENEWRKLVYVGAAHFLFIALVILFGVVGRLETHPLRLQVGIAGGIALVITLFAVAQTERVGVQLGMVTLQLISGSLLFAWLTVSLVHGAAIWHQWDAVAQKFTARRERHLEERTERTRRSEKMSRRSRSLALTLSGGGYRAALTHAGGLWALDQAAIPIRLLSTVSGGSIVGTAYALGWRPEEFIESLCGHRPGLRLTMLNAAPLLASIFVPAWNSGCERRAIRLPRRLDASVVETQGPPRGRIRYWRHRRRSGRVPGRGGRHSCRAADRVSRHNRVRLHAGIRGRPVRQRERP